MCNLLFEKKKKFFFWDGVFLNEINFFRDLKMWKWIVKFLLGMLKFVESSFCIEIVR